MSGKVETDMHAAAELIGTTDVEGLSAEGVIEVMLERLHPNLALACSFQKEESVILDLLLTREPNARVFALDTHVLFPESYALWRKIEQRYGVKIEVYEGPSLGRQAAIHGDALWASNPDLCCAIRKVGPLTTALAGLDGWITGVRRDQSATRAGHTQDRLGRAARAVEGKPARRLDGRRCLGLPPQARRAVQRAPRAWLRFDRLHALHQPGNRPRRPLGRERQDRVRPPRMTDIPFLSHLDALEAEAIHIMREVAAELERPVLLFSGGKDSIVLLRLAEKAFRPGRFPFPLMHVDTGHNFPEAIEYRDRRVAELGERLVVASVQESIDNGRVVEQTGPRASRNQLQTTTLLDAITEHGFDAAIGGARRDEERARAKERIFSFRDDFGQWDPRAQRPELWNVYNGKIRKGEQVRVFPISNWTELDVWQYVAREQLELPSIYFAHERDVFERDGMLYAASEFVERYDHEVPFTASVRFRTVGDMSCTGGVRSHAATIPEVVAEIASTRITERGETRADDKVSEAAMEDRKRVGYF